MRNLKLCTLAVLSLTGLLTGCWNPEDRHPSSFVGDAGLAASSWPKYRGGVRNTGRGFGFGATNALRWSAAAGSTDRIEGSPVIGSDGTLYIGADDGKLYAFDSVTGALRWAVVLQLKGVDSTPAIGADGTIYVGAGESLVALEPMAGIEKWRFLTAGDVESSPTLAPDGTIYVGSDDAKVYALDSQTGAFKWSFSFPEGSTTDSSPALGADGTVYIGSDEGMLVALRGNNGRLLWTFTAAGSIRGAPAVGPDGTVYVSVVGPVESETHTYAIDGKTGLPKWVQALPSNFATSVALGADGTVFVVGHEFPGPLAIEISQLRPVVWALDGRTGTVKWMRFLEPGAEGVSAPSLGGDGTVYVHAEKPFTTSGHGLLTALDSSNGQVKWEFTTGGSSNSCPTIGGDGTIYVGSDDGRVYAVR